MAKTCEQCGAKLGFFSKKAKLTLADGRSVTVCADCAASMQTEAPTGAGASAAQTAHPGPLLAEPHLIIREAEKEPVGFALQGAECTIGSVAENDVILHGDTVDRRHARIINKGGQYFLVDLRTHGGTWLGGKKVASPTPIEHRDTFQIGPYTLTLWSKK